ncbi:MAG: hypothetical protein J6J36_07065 [Clostridia bacterium]|nr:hypothetical protein [Clostridia bacterium]
MKIITKAAIRYKNKLYTGFDHTKCFYQITSEYVGGVELAYIEQGFITSDGDFVSREEALDIAREAGQLELASNIDTLMSEDLHSDWLERQEEELKELRQNFRTEQEERIFCQNLAVKRLEQIQELNSKIEQYENANLRDGVYLEQIGMCRPTIARYKNKTVVSVGLNIYDLCKFWKQEFELEDGKIRLIYEKEREFRTSHQRTLHGEKSIIELFADCGFICEVQK